MNKENTCSTCMHYVDGVCKYIGGLKIVHTESYCSYYKKNSPDIKQYQSFKNDN